MSMRADLDTLLSVMFIYAKDAFANSNNSRFDPFPSDGGELEPFSEPLHHFSLGIPRSLAA